MPIKVLYIEDELFLAKIVKESLESRGFDVVHIGDGDRALGLFKKEIPDICVLDIMLPHKDGFTIAEEIRKLNTDVPIIFLTAKTQTENVIQGFSSGGNDYIRKPFSVEELIVRIQHLLHRKNNSQRNNTEAVTMGKFTFYLNRQLLNDGTIDRRLSFRETELLRLLYESRERIINRQEILNLLWGSDSFFNSRNLDVYINKLRRYLKGDPAVEIITVKAVGYRFVVLN